MFQPALSILLFAATSVYAAKLLKAPFSSKLLPPTVHSLDLAAARTSDPHPDNLRWRSVPGAPLHNAVLKVLTSVRIGDQIFNHMLIDTGSAILWAGGEEGYQPGPNAQDINATFGVGYAVGTVSGPAFSDMVTIGGAQAKAQIIGAANVTRGFSLVKPIDGILGLGPSGGNAGDVSGFNATPTFVETLVGEGSIDAPIFGIFISPLGENGVAEGTGELTFGGVDDTRIDGDVTWVPQNPPVDFHWEFNVTGFSFGQVALTEPAPARTDTGNLGIQIPFDQLFAIRDAYNGTVAFDNTVLGAFLAFPSNATGALPPLIFALGDAHATFSIPPSRYLVPRSLYSTLNITDNLAHTWITSAGPGAFDFGQKWLENVYTAYDMVNHRVGFAHLA